MPQLSYVLSLLCQVACRSFPPPVNKVRDVRVTRPCPRRDEDLHRHPEATYKYKGGEHKMISHERLALRRVPLCEAASGIFAVRVHAPA